jgi:hypothetical protein
MAGWDRGAGKRKGLRGGDPTPSPNRTGVTTHRWEKRRDDVVHLMEGDRAQGIPSIGVTRFRQ